MPSAISLTPVPASPAFISPSLSSSSGTSNFPLLRRFLPCKISDQTVTAWTSAPSVDMKAVIGGENCISHHEHVRKEGTKCIVEPLKTSFLQKFPFSAQSAPFNSNQVSPSAVHHCCGRRKLSVMEAYQQIPMDTAGAYRLIDDETGESLIVWGGVDGNFPIPPKKAMSSKPEHNPREGGQKIVSSSLASFSRLKVPKIRSLIKNSLQVGDDSSISSIKAFATQLDEAKSVDLCMDSATDREPEGFPLPNARQRNKSSRDTLTKELGPTDAHEFSFGVNSSFRKWKDADSTESIRPSRKKIHKKLPADSGFFSRKSFRDLGCCDFMIETLWKQSIIRPSNIQAMAYSPVLEGKSCIIADQSGSGKTVAYLAPVVQLLREEELAGLGKSSSKNPRVVILAPTAELASQVLQNCRSMAKSGIPFRSVVATGGFRQKTQLEALNQELDVLIATPGRFMFLLQEGHVLLNNLKCVVLDEVDILFGDEDFKPVLQSFIRSAPMTVQYLFVTATLPVDVYNKLIEIFPDTEVVMGPGMHRTSSRLDEVLLDCSGIDGEEKNPETAFQNKKTALLQLVQESPVPKTIIFCNKIETCRKVENAFKRFDRQGIRSKILPFHAALAQELRLSNMEEFLKSESKEPMFLICTDRASRGIDFANVDHVVLFDFPRDPSEYVRRVGRTARGAMGRGKAFVFVVGKQVRLAKMIIERNQKGHPLHDVPEAYELQSRVLQASEQ
ncbi:DEAD-box ATP-dependent RNA helicase 50 isoform X2 [Phalaenopsis equestris]|uniref:DEAD-box ATP-dependent RNA helicase 50 isoform X2 n=1 Tax=Phalaenopsis equestris TaxID=78828 RepID=UPI0009E275F3|nr:DEAD-box ATP-dependent RNA helicase 50 isoform X2 [Phalaenopsis equestris]